ncbi:hypothetical protein WD019_03250 [Fictibacillus sp. Mic-4]|uniref:replication-relaxation family protein n=1 Tax=Fictibacillus sp. Mic-4 TaxID=3132826 RepID=UPI003CFB981C
MHFNNTKKKVDVCNSVMKRLRRDGYVTADTTVHPYNYFVNPAPIKKDSSKLLHFKAIVDFYIELCRYKKPSTFEIEPKVGEKGAIEPDIFMIWQNSPFYVEIQRTLYSQKVMDAKIERYKKYFYGESWKFEQWQPKGKKFFPYIWVLTDHVYKIDMQPLKIFQTISVNEFLNLVKKEYIK